MSKVITNLCIIQKDSRILLGMKKRGFGEGRWNSFGGKVEDGESMEDAVRREVLEEVGLNVKKLEKMGFIEFKFAESGKELDMHVFKAFEYTGEPKETEEMSPKWFDVNDIPFTQMWPEDSYWLPILLSGKKFKGKFTLDRPSTADYASLILEKNLEEVDEI